MIEVVGGSALGPGRLQKRLTAIRRTNPGARALNGNYLHFVDVDGTLTEDESRVLSALLTYGPRPTDEAPDAPPWRSGRRLLVVPAPRHDLALVVQGDRHRAHLRAGTRAAHRARHQLRRRSARSPTRRRCARALHDRMTESVLDRPQRRRAACSSTRHRARSSAVALGATGAARWRSANAELGLALSPDEIDYLVRRLPGAGPRPDRRRADDVRAGEQRALPPQDLQRRLRRSTASAQAESLFQMIRHTHRGAARAACCPPTRTTPPSSRARAAGRFFPDPDDAASTARTASRCTS